MQRDTDSITYTGRERRKAVGGKKANHHGNFITVLSKSTGGVPSQ